MAQQTTRHFPAELIKGAFIGLDIGLVMCISGIRSMLSCRKALDLSEERSSIIALSRSVAVSKRRGP